MCGANSPLCLQGEAKTSTASESELLNRLRRARDIYNPSAASARHHLCPLVGGSALERRVRQQCQVVRFCIGEHVVVVVRAMCGSGIDQM